MAGTEHIQVLTTVSSEAEAERIASDLLERRLAACVQVVGPIVSRYRWQGELEEEREWQCLARPRPASTTRSRPRSSRPILTIEPEVIATPIVAGSAGYLAWVSESLRSR